MQRFVNNFRSSLAAGIGSGDTSMDLATGEAADLPDVSAAEDYVLLTLHSGAQIEIVKVTDVAGDTLTVERGQEGTAAAAWSIGDAVEARTTAATLDRALAGGGGAPTAIIDESSEPAFDGVQGDLPSAMNEPAFGTVDVGGTLTHILVNSSALHYANVVGKSWANAANQAPPSAIEQTSAAIGDSLFVLRNDNGDYKVSQWQLTGSDPDADGVWTEHAEIMPNPRSNSGGAALGDEFYVIGGYSGGSVANVEAYDTVANTWSTKASLPVPLYKPSCVSDGSNIYVFGGENPFGTVTDRIYKYDPVGDSWSEVAQVTFGGASNSAAVVVGDLIHFIGGNGGNDRHVIFDPSDDSIVSNKLLPSATPHGAGFVAGSDQDEIVVQPYALGTVADGQRYAKHNLYSLFPAQAANSPIVANLARDRDGAGNPLGLNLVSQSGSTPLSSDPREKAVGILSGGFLGIEATVDFWDHAAVTFAVVAVGDGA